MRRILFATPPLALAVAACTGTASYKDQTEDFLNDKAQVETQVGADVSDADCEEPDSTDVGTTYTCTANVGDSGPSSFDVCIDKKNSFLVQVYESGAEADPANPAPCPPVGTATTEPDDGE